MGNEGMNSPSGANLVGVYTWVLNSFRSVIFIEIPFINTFELRQEWHIYRS